MQQNECVLAVSYADLVLQAVILTAIVIGFSIQARHNKPGLPVVST
ncbi:hypothetical protein IQ241_19285 [Romeria aff. gracilis LEGE 07310]|uniref:Uncharacterized protein n=1 Tax=Vasconcelosia minhoensis LEGE 07310 TaxID=915328 RepID=A0A8J7DRW1_9CYAN|nr:hypothetical protein [Romeria gracilis]MBE9079414.1 hypothetical protein [Romeria aff. gracilis LEGE 07310]